MVNPKLLCQILNVYYEKNRMGEVCSDITKTRSIYPHDWAFLSDEVQILILTEAINKNILLVDTDEYSKHEEGVRHPLEELDSEQDLNR